MPMCSLTKVEFSPRYALMVPSMDKNKLTSKPSMAAFFFFFKRLNIEADAFSFLGVNF